MSKQDLIIETLPYMQCEEKQLLEKSGKSLGWLCDEGFKDETRSLVELMNSLYAVYDDLEKKDREESIRRMKDSGLVKVVHSQDEPLYKKSGLLSDLIKSVGEENLQRVINTPKLDYSIFKRRDN